MQLVSMKSATVVNAVSCVIEGLTVVGHHDDDRSFGTEPLVNDGEEGRECSIYVVDPRFVGSFEVAPLRCGRAGI